MKTLAEVLNIDIPVIVADADGFIVAANAPFHQTYRWSQEDLAGKSISAIIPPALRDAHHLGFSRFKLTRAPKIQDTPLDLEIWCGDGSVRLAQHFIWHQDLDGAEHFIATITPKTQQADV